MGNATQLRCTGKLGSWNDDRGFGFVEPSRGMRRPRVGDMIVFSRVVQADGKLKAVDASIVGELARTRVPRWSGWVSAAFTLLFLLALVTNRIGLFRGAPHTKSEWRPISIDDASPPPALGSTAGTIKGNISQTTGRKWYHVPGSRDYARTVISPEYGERWFRTEEEAVAAGWQKAPN